ncbi:MAG: GIY-YIG nuclease family protein [Patescibacteria group bacterium]
MYFVYILLSYKDNRTYVGYAKNLTARLYEHNCGRVKATKHRRPFKMFYSEQFPTLKEAKKRELWWKSSRGRSELKKFFV